MKERNENDMTNFIRKDTQYKKKKKTNYAKNPQNALSLMFARAFA